MQPYEQKTCHSISHVRLQGDPPTNHEEMHRVDVPGQPEMSLSEGDADKDAQDLRETQQKGCFGQDASSKEQLAEFARVA